MSEDLDSEFTAEITGEFRSGDTLSEEEHRAWLQSKIKACLSSAFAEFEVSNIEVRLSDSDNKTENESGNQ